MQQPEFDAMLHQAAAEQWARCAADAARAAGQQISHDTIDAWLERGAPPDARQLKATDPERWRELRDMAAERVPDHAALAGVWG